QRVVHEVRVDGVLRGVRDWLFGYPVGGYFGAVSGRPPPLDDDAFGDGEQPGPRGTAGVVEPGEVAHGAKEGFLHHVLGLAVVSPGQPDRVGPQGRPVPVVQRAQLIGFTPDQSRGHALPAWAAGHDPAGRTQIAPGGPPLRTIPARVSYLIITG